MNDIQRAIFRKQNEIAELYRVTSRPETIFKLKLARLRRELKQLQDIPGHMYNVGCMISYMNYTPRTLSEIIKGENK
jgi:hypothetical protein